VAFFVSLFPEDRVWITAGLYLAFMLISFLTMGLASRYRTLAAQSSETFLGGAMLVMTAYFVLSVTVMPQFADLDSVYRLACRPTATGAGGLWPAAVTALFALAAFAIGFAVKMRTIRSLT
jgi:predicted transporter